jgi:hypothetical protein
VVQVELVLVKVALEEEVQEDIEIHFQRKHQVVEEVVKQV